MQEYRLPGTPLRDEPSTHELLDAITAVRTGDRLRSQRSTRPRAA